MYQINENLKSLYKQANVYKQLVLYFPELDLTITNDKIVDKSFTLTESICSDTDLTFGACEAAAIEVIVADIIHDLSGKLMIVTQIVDNTYEMPLGTYTVDTAQKQSDKRFKEIIAYDFMLKTDKDVSAWYNGLIWPQTIKSMRESLLTYLGLEYEDQTLTNDTVSIDKTINPTSLVGRDMLRQLCSINAGFGHFTRNGKFKVIQLSGLGLYPSETLYPEEDLFPSESGETITTGSYRTIDYSEYIVEPITMLKIQADDEDTGVTSGTGSNAYIMTGNYLLFGKSSADLQVIADAMFLQMKNKYYRQHTTVMNGLPYMEAGDSVLVVTSNDAIESFMFKRELTGIHTLVDTISATGNQYRPQRVTPNTQIQQLKSKTLKIQKSVDQLSIDMEDMEEGLQSQITLTAGQLQTQITDNKNDAESQISQLSNNISLKVSKGDVSSQLSIEPGQVTFNSNRLIVNSNNFKLDDTGNAEFSGKVRGATIDGSKLTSENEDKTQKTTIENGTIVTSYINVQQSGTTDYVGITSGGIILGGGSTLSVLNGGEITTPKLNGGVPSLVGHTHTSLYNDNGTPQVTSFGSNFRPHSSSGDNSVSCGSPSYRWTQVYAATATISTSDRALKEQEALITEKEKKVALKIKQLLKTFKYKNAVSAKGDKARIHTGVIAQDVKEAFESEDLNPYDYALFCSDTWYEKEGRACDEEESFYTASDEGVTEVIRLGIRYEELLCFIMAAL